MDMDLNNILQRIQSRLIVVFVDACFSGVAGGRTFEGPKLQRIKSKYRSIISLRNINLGEGRIILSAADDDQPALEDQKLGHGIFSFALFDALTNPDLTQNTISIAALYDYVANKVLDLSGENQAPVLNGRSKLGKIPRFIDNPS